MERVFYDVVPLGDMWSIRSKNYASKGAFAKKDDAVDQAIALAKQFRMLQGVPTSVRVHGSDGKIQEERTYGDDPYPPKG